MYRKPLTVLDSRLTLRKKSSPFPPPSEMSDQDWSEIQDLQDTFNVLEGYGLALPQLGILKRGVIVNFSALGLPDMLTSEVMINPELETWGEDQRNEEACFSVPHISAFVRRPTSCRVRYTNLQGELKTIELEGFPAACLQHEIDHLDGVLYIDKAGRVYAGMLLKKCLKAEKKLQKEKEAARLEFENEHRELMGFTKTKTTSTRKRASKKRKKRPNRSKKK